jgi:hypothetical protein
MPFLLVGIIIIIIIIIILEGHARKSMAFVSRERAWDLSFAILLIGQDWLLLCC